MMDPVLATQHDALSIPTPPPGPSRRAAPLRGLIVGAAILAATPGTADAQDRRSAGMPRRSPSPSALSLHLDLPAGDGPEHCFGPGIVDTDELADHIVRRLSGNVVGFGFAISEGGNPVALGQGGFAQIPFLDSDVLFTFHSDINVFSVSKPITAIAALQLMEELGLEPEDPIADWLPADWAKGDGFDDGGITFVDLLTHQSGVLQVIAELVNDDPALPSTNTWEGLEVLVEKGVAPDLAATTCPELLEDGTYEIGTPEDPEGQHYGVYCYKNANYALARLLIWRMALANGDLDADEFDQGDPEAQPLESALGYEEYVRQNVLQPAGVDGRCSPTGPPAARALAYDIDGNIPLVMVTAGTPTLSDGTEGLLSCGPKNWWLSALDLVSIVGELSCGDLLSDESRELMDSWKMGWTRNSNSATYPGRYWHGGHGLWTEPVQKQLLWPLHPDNPTKDEVLPAEGPAVNHVRTCFMRLPHGIDAALILNSNLRGSDDTACDVLLQAFDDAT